jgi:hypothetical protein
MKNKCLKKPQKGIKIFPYPEIPLYSPFFKGGGFFFSKRKNRRSLFRREELRGRLFKKKGTVIPPLAKGGVGILR